MKILVIVASVWMACAAQTASRSASPPPAKPAQTQTKTDAELERAIRARFAKSKIAVNNFQVRVQGGIATIEGTTSVVQHKGAATRMARGAGAKEVVNKVKISEAARKKAAAQLAHSR